MKLSISLEDSHAINRALKRYLQDKAEGKELPTLAEYSADFGISRANVDRRVYRIRRGMYVPPENWCDCDEAGPCLTHFQEALKRERDYKAVKP